MSDRRWGADGKVITAINSGMLPERLDVLHNAAQKWVDDDNAPAVIIKAMRHGMPVFEAAYGSMAPGRPQGSLPVDAIFPVASITKAVTATLIMIMQEDGLLCTSLRAREFFPQFTGDKDWRIMIWHLLSHCSGLVDDEISEDYDDFVTNKLGIARPGEAADADEWNGYQLKIREKMDMPPVKSGCESELWHDTYRNVVLALPTRRNPHKFMSYCSFGYNLLGEIICNTTGKSLDEYASEKLFRPLGMIDSHFHLPKEKYGRLVQRLPTDEGGQWANSCYDSNSGAGGLKSTVHDITRFAQMFLGNHGGKRGTLDGVRILSPATVAEMSRNHNKDIPSTWVGLDWDSSWGLGWNVRGAKNDDCGMLRSAHSIQHSGASGLMVMADFDRDLVCCLFQIHRKNGSFGGRCMNMAVAAIDE